MVTDQGTRSPIELFWTAKEVPLIIIMVVMIIMIVMMVILMIMMTKNIHISLVLSNNVPTL